MKQNLGKLDRILRFLLAFWWLSPWMPQFGNWFDWVIFVVAWIALVESLTGLCPLHDILGINNKSQ